MANRPNSKQDSQKRAKLSQTEFPNNELAQAERISQAIWDNFAGKGAAPHDVAISLEMSPTSGTWRNLCGSAIAYGLTEGGYAADQINLTALGRRIVSPTEEGDDNRARVEAVLKPRARREFFEKGKDGEYNEIWRPSENVVYELGAASIRWERKIIIVREDGVNFPSDFSDLGYITFKDGEIANKAMEIFKELIGLGLVKVMAA